MGGMPGTEVLVGSAELGTTVLLEIGADSEVGAALDRVAVTVTVTTEIGGAVVAAAATPEGNISIKERTARSSVHLKMETMTRPKARNGFWEEDPKPAHNLGTLFVHLAQPG